MAIRVNTGRSKATSVGAPNRTDFVRGSWPISSRATPPQRITPALKMRDYGKQDASAGGDKTPFGNTGMTSRS